MKDSRIILGIDPGTNVMGYGLLKVENKKTTVITMGAITTVKLSTHYDKLKYIFTRVLAVVDEYKPDEVALEAPFFGKNVQSMLKLGRAQGVAMAAALYRDLPIFEYAPLKVKQAITGMGRASKEQVAYFLQKMYGLTDLPKDLDATDALAVAFCHYLQSGKIKQEKAYSGWGDFIKKNPGRIKK
ncbi:MAG: crossover junction endodeoxyribonuclease RuvC [Prolixibacteraceae bacterium]|jgi:crossover junction endodeoxyribonuclease RuvC|nr:crossover junction endodeoxyribonuclease RuvC [Prolixibacteraceae bacterium]